MINLKCSRWTNHVNTGLTCNIIGLNCTATVLIWYEFNLKVCVFMPGCCFSVCLNHPFHCVATNFLKLQNVCVATENVCVTAFELVCKDKAHRLGMWCWRTSTSWEHLAHCLCILTSDTIYLMYLYFYVGHLWHFVKINK